MLGRGLQGRGRGSNKGYQGFLRALKMAIYLPRFPFLIFATLSH
jgi:hypothetical protein